MSLRVPLEVRLKTSRRDVHVTNDIGDLGFRSTSPGGFASAGIDLHRPISFDPDEVRQYGRLYVTDARNLSTVWEGRMEDPGRSAGSNGEVYAITAMGPAAHASDVNAPYVAVDNPLASLTRTDNVTPGATDSTGDDPGGSGLPALVMQFPAGLPLVVNSRVAMIYRTIAECGQKVAAFNYSWDAGATTSLIEIDTVARPSGTVARADNLAVAGGAGSRKVVVTNFTNGDNIIVFRLIRTGGAVTYGTDDIWGSIFSASVRALLLNADGTERTTGYTADTVLFSEIVNDLLGRWLPQFDGANASVATTAFGIDQFAFPAGVTAADAFAEGLKFEPGYTWHAWESNAAGKYRFELIPLATTVRYECVADDGFDSPGSTDGLYNRVQVIGRDAGGRQRSLTATLAVAALTDEGLTRDGPPIDLGDGWTAVNAQRAGDQFLAEHATPPNQGKLTISRPVLDRVLGRYVDPWEIRPGSGLFRVRGVQPRYDSLNPVGRDGVSVFRGVATDYSQGSNTVGVDLDSYSRQEAVAIADIQKRLARIRR